MRWVFHDFCYIYLLPLIRIFPLYGSLREVSKAIYGQVNIVCDEDCGNAPKKILLRDWQSAFVQGTHNVVLEHLTEAVAWEFVGVAKIEGKAAAVELLRQAASDEKSELRILDIIKHGATGSVNGTVSLADGTDYSFCHVFTFNGAGKTAKSKELRPM